MSNEIVDKCLKRGKYEQSVRAVDQWLEDYTHDNPEFKDVIDSHEGDFIELVDEMETLKEQGFSEKQAREMIGEDSENMEFDSEEEEWLRGEIVDDRFTEVRLL